MATRVLITGATGFVGGHLAEALATRGAMLFGLSRGGRWPRELKHLESAVDLRTIDLAERPAVERILAEVKPDWILHLAGYAHAGRSFQESDAAWAANLVATRNLYEAVIRWGGTSRILFASSGLVYGEAASGEHLVDESAPLRPASPYAASKAAADLASGQYARHPGLDVVIARAFNHVGPRQAADYAVARFASQIAAIERGRQPPILETGDLDAARDLTDVRDVVRAYVLLLEKGRRGGAYNVGSGQARRIGDVLDRLLAISGARVEVRSRTDARPGEKVALLADAGKLRLETGWRPEITLEQTLSDTLDYWRQVTR
jgi:GDP-4-dehydro-6-deoxy-D-mannose reductase